MHTSKGGQSFTGSSYWGESDDSYVIAANLKINAPSVYFAVGISCAGQHLAGIANAKCVVAISKDEEANIFKRARFGIVANYKRVIPSLIKVLAEEQ
ncbi:MAG: hypothetical protein RBT11_14635 [Desulfobacterales bacterium]|jgi:electron transfer flavoprotein alpha subunit|nr:hypothetical protein [Desulfobacterales bacterium]